MFDKPLIKRVKRHVSSRIHSFFAVTAPGLETLCYHEISALPGIVARAEIVSGGVEFKGRLQDAYAANLDLRTPIRILMRIAGFKASNFRQLEKQLDRIPWELHINPCTLLQVNVKTIHSRLFHSAAISDRFKRNIDATLYNGSAKQIPDTQDSVVQNLFVRVLDDHFVVSLDSSGDALYKRGIKTDVGKAPLRETLAAAALAWAGYSGKEPLIDPMCGSGTFSLEAASISRRIPPGWYRNFAFMNWPAFKTRQWQYLKKVRSRQIALPAAHAVFASDIDPKACTSLESVVRKSGMSGTINVAEADFFTRLPHKISRQPGVVTLNPPFGIRLGSIRQRHHLYTEIAEKLKKDYKKWRTAIFLPDRYLADRFPAGLKRRSIPHGGLELTLLTGRID